MNIFITFSSSGYEWASKRICQEAMRTGFFDRTIALNEKQLSPELLLSDTFKIKKGLGHYSWKPDAIWLAMQQCNEGDILVYCDAGCVLHRSKEWVAFSKIMRNVDILAFRIHQPNYKWTRKSVIEHFTDDIKYDWINSFQMGANCLVVRNNENGRSFISDWRYYMISRLDLCGDVPENELQFEDHRLVENRYDQTILTALTYKYKEKGIADIHWEHFEGKDLLRTQAIVAARLRNESCVDNSSNFLNILKCFIKQYIYYPYLNIFRDI